MRSPEDGAGFGGSENANLAISILSRIPDPGMLPVEPQAPQPPAPQTPVPQTPAPQPAAPQTPAPQPPGPAPLPAEVKTRLGGRYGTDAAPLFQPAQPPQPPAPGEPGEEAPDASKPGHAFAQLRYENNQYKKQVIPALEAAKKAAEDAKAEAEAKVAAILAEKEKADQEKTGLLEQLGRVSLTESPQFKEKYATREMQIAQKLSGALTKFAGMTPEEAMKVAAQVQGSVNDAGSIAKATEGLHPAVAGAALIAAQEFAALDEERNAEVSNWRQTSAASGVQQSREAVVRSAEERKALATDAVEHARTKLMNPIFASTDPEESQQVADVVDAFHGFIQRASESELVRAAAEGFTAPFLVQRIEERDAYIQELQTQLQGYQHALGIPVGQEGFVPPAPPKAPAMPSTTQRAGSLEETAMRFASDAVTGFFKPR